MQTIAEKNDVMRKTFLMCKVLFTEGVSAREEFVQQEIIRAVQNFNKFTPDNDPHGEHDFGKVTVLGCDYFWKFDYYDDKYEGFKEDGNRVLTIMRSDEY